MLIGDNSVYNLLWHQRQSLGRKLKFGDPQHVNRTRPRRNLQQPQDVELVTVRSQTRRLGIHHHRQKGKARGTVSPLSSSTGKSQQETRHRSECGFLSPGCSLSPSSCFLGTPPLRPEWKNRRTWMIPSEPTGRRALAPEVAGKASQRTQHDFMHTKRRGSERC